MLFYALILCIVSAVSGSKELFETQSNQHAGYLQRLPSPPSSLITPLQQLKTVRSELEQLAYPTQGGYYDQQYQFPAAQAATAIHQQAQVVNIPGQEFIAGIRFDTGTVANDLAVVQRLLTPLKSNLEYMLREPVNDMQVISDRAMPVQGTLHSTKLSFLDRSGHKRYAGAVVYEPLSGLPHLQAARLADKSTSRKGPMDRLQNLF